MLVIDFLRGFTSLESGLEELKAKFAIDHKFSDCGKLLSLAYCQLDSPKRDPIVRECRGLVLSVGLNIVARSFFRFFNHSEFPEDDSKFVWDGCEVREKVDGSLILCYWHDGAVRINTRNSFGQGKVAESFDGSWEQLFWSTGVDKAYIEPFLREHYENGHPKTLVFELCSVHNQVVRLHPEPVAYLLDCVDNTTGRSLEQLNFLTARPGWEGKTFLDFLGFKVNAKRPLRFSMKSHECFDQILEAANDDTFEGVVITDENNLRLKIKGDPYCILHATRSGDNILLPQYMIPLILSGKHEELPLKFPFIKVLWEEREAKLKEIRESLEVNYEKFRGLETQKDFAIAIKDVPLKNLLFEARKHSKEVREVWKESEDSIIKYFKEKK